MVIAQLGNVTTTMAPVTTTAPTLACYECDYTWSSKDGLLNGSAGCLDPDRDTNIAKIPTNQSCFSIYNRNVTNGDISIMLWRGYGSQDRENYPFIFTETDGKLYKAR